MGELNENGRYFKSMMMKDIQKYLDYLEVEKENQKKKIKEKRKSRAKFRRKKKKSQ